MVLGEMPKVAQSARAGKASSGLYEPTISIMAFF